MRSVVQPDGTRPAKAVGTRACQSGSSGALGFLLEVAAND